MTMSNQEYLEAYEAWKDQVNTEDQDTPERFAYHLKNLENEQIVEGIKEYLEQRLDELDATGAVDFLKELLPIARLSGLGVDWWEPKALTPGELKSFQE